MNVFCYEFKNSFKSMLYWLCTAILITLVFLLMFPYFKEESQTVLALFEGFPPEVLKSFGFDPVKFFEIEGYLSFLFMYILICVGLQATNLSLGIFSKEKRFKTFDFILTKPKKRGYIFGWKALCVLAYVVINTLLYSAALFIMISFVEKGSYDIKYIILLGIVILLTQLILASVGALLGVVLPKIKSVSSISIIIVLGLYMVQMVENFLESSTLKYINPFGMYDSMEILKTGSISSVGYGVGIVMIIIFTASSALMYMKKDIHVS